MFNRFDDSGLYLFIEYYTGEENARLTENGELFRIRDNCTQNNLELPQGILVREGNRAALYECQKETCPVKDLRIRGEVVWTSPLQEYEIIEQKYLDAGYEWYLIIIRMIPYGGCGGMLRNSLLSRRRKYNKDFQ